ncbi:hypothetical protein [Dyella sp.]|uniref:hypothetical protein n=1 Tax=Dyella sp. TaxID=1869338 RepID=UPI002ED37D39
MAQGAGHADQPSVVDGAAASQGSGRVSLRAGLTRQANSVVRLERQLYDEHAALADPFGQSFSIEEEADCWVSWQRWGPGTSGW